MFAAISVPHLKPIDDKRSNGGISGMKREMYRRLIAADPCGIRCLG
jgi:hypothetical protein